jgi:hypothetical protein
MRIIIVGVNHQIQPVEILSCSSNGGAEKFEKEQKDKFAELLQKKITENDVEIVGEEARHGHETVTQRVCESEGCRHTNVEMTPEERIARDIPGGYNENPGFPEADRERCNKEREDYMATKALAEANGADSMMVICGSRHLEALAQRFRAAGHTVKTVPLQDQPWYIEDWATHMMINL